MADILNGVKSEDIDDILDEIEKNEQEIISTKTSSKQTVVNIEWNEIINQMQQKNISYIKNLITSRDIDINAQNPENGLALLHYAVIVGSYDLVKAICNFGADVKIEDHQGDDALKYAIKYGRYKITELIFYRTLSGSLGRDLKSINAEIRARTEQANDIYGWSNDYDFKSAIIDYMCHVLEERKPFGPDLLFYAWHIVCKNGQDPEDYDDLPLSSKLWDSLIFTYESILRDTSDKIG